MPIRYHFFTSFFVLIFSIISLALIVFLVDPKEADAYLKSIFFISIFLILQSCFFLLISLFKKELHISEALRFFKRSFFLAILGTVILIFSSQKMLGWASFIILISLFMGSELYFSWKER